MKDDDSRTHQMLVRSREFFAQQIEDFSETGAARQLFNELKVYISTIEQQAAAHATGIAQARQGTRTRGEMRQALQDDIDAIYRVARTMGLESQFPRPALNNDEALIQSADAYAVNALPLKAQFIAHELPADFLEDLAADKAAFRDSIADQGNAVGDHVSARAELDDALEQGVIRVRKLDGIMKVKYADSPGKLAEWLSASHIERAPRRTKTAPSPSSEATSGSGASPPPA